MCKNAIDERSGINKLLDDLLIHLEQRGYAQSSLRTYGGIYKRLRAYCADKGAGVFTEDLGWQFMSDCYGAVLGEKDRLKNISRAVAMLSDFQRFGMIFPQSYRDRQEFSAGFCNLMEGFLSNRGKHNLANGTLTRYRHFLLRFELFLLERNIACFSQIQPYHINAYIESFAGYSKNSTAFALNMMKSLFNYAYETGFGSVNYSAVVPRVAYAQYNRIPTVFSEDEIERILKCIDTNNPIGKRNYAVILIAARLGIRVSDIINLRFEEIDWSAKVISIVQQKTGEPLSLPLPDDVGWAIINYLRFGRPVAPDNCDYVFVRHNAPYGKLTSCFQKDLQRAIQKAGISVKPNSKVGMYSFRHSLASNLLSKGTEIAEIAQILGHSTTEVTEEYLRITPALLQECALEVEF